VHAISDKQMADIQAAADAEAPAEAAATEAVDGTAPADGEIAAAAAVPDGDDIRMEDVLGAGTRKRPAAIIEDVDELQAETRRS